MFFQLLLLPLLARSQIVDPTSLASQYALTTSTSFPFPEATLASSDAQSFIVDGWSLSKGRIQNGADDLSFVADPFPDSSVPSSTTTDNTSAPVLQVTYPAGSFSHDTGGAQLYSLWNTTDGSVFDSMLLTYEIAFDDGFQFVKGGKLPGLRGGPDPDGCSGGSAATGSNCFSTRVMWRSSAEGEVYAYIPTTDALCSNSDVLCNQDGFGTSIDRGIFSFDTAQWSRVTLLVRLNSPVDSANGQIMLYYNNVQAINETGLIFRNSTDISVGGLYFSTFFGGDDSSWATPKTVHTYFRNIELWGSSAASDLAASAAPGHRAPLLTVAVGLIATAWWFLN